MSQELNILKIKNILVQVEHMVFLFKDEIINQ